MKYEDYEVTKPFYVDKPLKDWIEECLNDNDNYMVEECENDDEMFSEFIKTLPYYEDKDVMEQNIKELKEHKSEVIKIMRDWQSNTAEAAYSELVDALVEYISDLDIDEITDVYCPDKKMRLKALKEAINILYNEQ